MNLEQNTGALYMLKEFSRRNFLSTLVAGAAACTDINLKKSDAKSLDRPNILFIMADDLGKEWISCYGAEDLRTPNIDALAAGGMKFRNAYSMPQCTPSRVSVLTGQYPWRTGWVNHWDVPRWGVGYFDWRPRRNTRPLRAVYCQWPWPDARRRGNRRLDRFHRPAAYICRTGRQSPTRGHGH